MSRYCVQISWDEVAHLDEDAKRELFAAIPPYQRDARSRGIPVLGSGVIYPVPEAAYVVEPFDLPAWWPRAYALDVGWNRTAALWGAWDRESDTIYLYSEHYRGQAEPSIHADAIKVRGEWIWGAIDPGSAGSSQVDGRQLIEEYRKLGLSLTAAENTVEAGIHAVYRRLSGGRLKVFRSLSNTISELRIYRRDEKGKVVKENDHLMDALRYLVMTGMQYASVDPGPVEEDWKTRDAERTRSAVTGY